MVLLRTQKRIEQGVAQEIACRGLPVASLLKNIPELPAKKLLCLFSLLLLTSCGTTVGTPSSNLAGAPSKYGIQLTWAAPGGSNPAESYNVYREVTGGTAGFEQINSSPVLQPAYTDKTVQLGVSYTYEVRAVGAGGGESPPSNTTIVTVPSN